MNKKKLLGLFCMFLLGIYFVNLGIVRASDDDVPVTVEIILSQSL